MALREASASSTYAPIPLIAWTPESQQRRLLSTTTSAVGWDRPVALIEPPTISLPRLEFIRDLHIAGWQLAQPLQISIERDEDGTFLVSDSVSTVYGVGDTLDEAKHDYVVSLVDYYELIAIRAIPTDEPTSLVVQQLQRYLQPTTT